MKKLTILLLALLMVSPLYADNYQRYEENGKIGIKDTQGVIVLPASFDALGWSDGSFSVIGQVTGYRKNNQWGLISLNKQFITASDFESLMLPGGDRVIASKTIKPFGTKFGCLDLKGKVVIPFVYDAINLHGLRAVVMKKNGVQYRYGLIDLNDRQILPTQYKKILPIGSLRYMVGNFSNKEALCSEEGRWITDFVIDSISSFHNDLAVLYNGWKRGVIDRNGEIKIESQYKDVQILDSGKVLVRTADLWKLLDEQYRELSKTESDDLTFLSDNLVLAIRDGKCGLVDGSLQLRWPMEYERIELAGNLFVAKKNGKFNLLRADQSRVLDFESDSLCVDKNFVRRMTGQRWELYDTFGIKKNTGSHEALGPFNGRFFPAKNRGFWGGVDRYGKETVACVYDSLIDFREDLIAVRFKGAFGIIDVEDHWRLMPQKYPVTLVAADRFIEKQDSLFFLKDLSGNMIYFTDLELKIHGDHLVERLKDGTQRDVSFQGQTIVPAIPLPVRATEVFQESEGLIGIKRDGKYGFIDSRGRLRIANRYEAIGQFHEGLSPVRILGKWGFINKDDQIVIQPSFEYAANFDRGLAKAYHNGKAGLIDREGKMILEFRYDSIRGLPNGHFLITLDSRKGLASENGRLLIEPRFDQLTILKNDRVIVKLGNRCGILTIDGLSVLPLRYDKLEYWPSRKSFLAKQSGDWQTIWLK